MMAFHKKNSRIFASFLVLFSSILLTGCSFKDIDKRAFVVAIGIDPAENDKDSYKVTLKIALSIKSIKDATSASYAYMSKESNSMSDAIRFMESHNGKAIEFGHTRLIAINESLLAEDLHQFMDYFTRRGDIQLISWVAAAKPTAEEILKVEPTTESVASLSLFNFFDHNGSDSPFIVTTFLFEFRRDFFAKGIEAVIPLIETNAEKKELIINKSVIIKKNHESLNLTAVQTLYYNSLVNDATGYSYKANLDDLSLLLFVQKFKMTYKIITRENKPPRADIKIRVIGNVIESSEPLSIYSLDKYNKLVASDLKNVVLDVLTSAQEKELDPIGFGLRYRATRMNNKNTFSEWEKMYPDLEFNIDFKIDIQSLGAIE